MTRFPLKRPGTSGLFSHISKSCKYEEKDGGITAKIACVKMMRGRWSVVKLRQETEKLTQDEVFVAPFSTVTVLSPAICGRFRILTRFVHKAKKYYNAIGHVYSREWRP